MTRIAWLIPVLLFITLHACAQPASGPLVGAKAAILMDRQSGVVLWSLNPDLELPMASTTKIMTAMVILDHGSDKLHESVRVSRHAFEVASGGSSVFAAGDVVSLNDLLSAALLRSSNEATVAAAEYLAGDEKTFIGWMNDKAAALGLRHTHFTNPHGFTRPKNYATNHYSSARDLAIITRYALTSYPLIRKIVDTAHNEVQATPRGLVVLDNHNRILHAGVPGVPGARVDGVKTGYMLNSGKCFVGSATLGDWQLIAVTLNDVEMFPDSLTLFNYGFTHYSWALYANNTQAAYQAPVRFGASPTVPLAVDGALGAPVLKPQYGGDDQQDRIGFSGEQLKAPIRQGQQVGTLTLYRNGKPLVSANAIALEAVPVAWWIRLGRAAGYTALTLVVLLGIGALYGTRTKNARRRRRELAARSRGTH